jgi:NadR type nicotinamide-nucleotide adenylyltransferase
METFPLPPDDVVRVVLTGSESTGKSTLAAELARYYGAPLVPEFLRAFVQRHEGPLEFEHQEPIARGQIALEDEHIARARGVSPLVVLDTDLLSTVVYSYHYYGRCHAWIDAAARARRPDLYVLCETDVAWLPDGVRDRGGQRDEMQALFLDAVRDSGSPYVSVSGTIGERLAQATNAIDAMLLARGRSA